MPSSAFLEKLIRQAIPVVEDTAGFLRQELGKVSSGQIEEKFLNGLVSYVDRKAEEQLVSGLRRILPEATFHTEEETVATSDSEWQWIIDPLDGTTNFLHELPHFAISIGLKAGNRLVLGIVHHVTQQECYYAWDQGGAWCNGRPIRVSDRGALHQSLIATGFPYHNFARSDQWFHAIQSFLQRCRGIRRFGAAALDLAYVANGRFDIFFEYGLSPWDVAGGAVLVREAGGRVCDFNGGEDFLYGQEILVTNALVFDETLQIIREAFSGLRPTPDRSAPE
jgi:myo-inositol-1(or 4)-monophosphatase